MSKSTIKLIMAAAAAAAVYYLLRHTQKMVSQMPSHTGQGGYEKQTSWSGVVNPKAVNGNWMVLS